MPYIKNEKFNRMLLSIGVPAASAGELNFQITSMIKKYMQEHGKSYQTINDIVGALEGAKLEFYRRVVSKYEEEKINENGDVY